MTLVKSSSERVFSFLILSVLSLSSLGEREHNRHRETERERESNLIGFICKSLAKKKQKTKTFWRSYTSPRRSFLSLNTKVSGTDVHLCSSLYHSKAAGGTAIASQRRMAVLPRCAGIFFMSVIIGGSDNIQYNNNNNKAVTNQDLLQSKSICCGPVPLPTELYSLQMQLCLKKHCFLME